MASAIPAGIEFREGKMVDLAQLAALRAAAGWSPLGLDVLAQQVAGSRWVWSALLGTQLIGFVRAISDGVTNAYVCTFVVDEAYRGRGIGRRLLEHMMEGHPGVRWVLHSREEVTGFYEKCGFEPASSMYRRDRRS